MPCSSCVTVEGTCTILSETWAISADSVLVMDICMLSIRRYRSEILSWTSWVRCEYRSSLCSRSRIMARSASRSWSERAFSASLSRLACTSCSCVWTYACQAVVSEVGDPSCAVWGRATRNSFRASRTCGSTCSIKEILSMSAEERCSEASRR